MNTTPPAHTATRAPDLTTKLLLAVTAAALSVIALRPLLAPSVAVAAPGAGGGSTSGNLVAIYDPNYSQTTVFALAGGKVTVIQKAGDTGKWRAVGIVPLAK